LKGVPPVTYSHELLWSRTSECQQHPACCVAACISIGERVSNAIEARHTTSVDV
jgi:hypothetical protein